MHDELLSRIRTALAAQPDGRFLITVDGPCGSGKSTLAAALATALGADVVHMDDFVVPHEHKTPERLAQPGGNADHERLLREVIAPWRSTGHAAYRPYLCHEDAMGGENRISGRVLILEGSYSNLPPIREAASLRLFVTVDDETRMTRLQGRVGSERLEAFHSRWIPLENAYFAAFGLPDAGCIVVPG